MRVLKEGNWNDPWSTQIDCPTCKASLFVEEGDLKAYDNSQDFYCHCACCGKIVPKIGRASCRERVYVLV